MAFKTIWRSKSHSLVVASGALLLVACTNQPVNQATASNTSAGTLLQADAVLHERLQAVLSADDAYAHFVMQPVASDTLDAKSETIAQAEIALQKTMDSLEQTKVKTSNAAEWQQIIGYFKNILQSRRGLSDLRMVVSANNDDSTTMQHTLAQLHAQLQEKDKKIASLERTGNQQTQAFMPNNEALAKEKASDTGVGSYAPAKGETLADLKQRNKNLYKAYSDLQVKYFVMGRNYLVLKQEHERTLKELATLRQPSNQ